MAIAARVSQQVVEYAGTVETAARVSQAVVEYAKTDPVTTRISQFVIEYIAFANPVPVPPTPETFKIRWLRRSPTVFHDGLRVFHRRFQLDCLVGQGVGDGGTGANPSIRVRTSDDGGFTWSSWREMATGRVGQYLTIAKLYQLGAAYNRVYEVSGDDPVAFAIVQAFLDIEGGSH